jgi:hypothetical protein
VFFAAASVGPEVKEDPRLLIKPPLKVHFKIVISRLSEIFLFHRNEVVQSRKKDPFQGPKTNPFATR